MNTVRIIPRSIHRILLAGGIFQVELLLPPPPLLLKRQLEMVFVPPFKLDTPGIGDRAIGRRMLQVAARICNQLCMLLLQRRRRSVPAAVIPTEWQIDQHSTLECQRDGAAAGWDGVNRELYNFTKRLANQIHSKNSRHLSSVPVSHPILPCPSLDRQIRTTTFRVVCVVLKTSFTLLYF